MVKHCFLFVKVCLIDQMRLLEFITSNLSNIILIPTNNFFYYLIKK